MNPEPQILNLATPTDHPENSDALVQYHHRGTGKVARLPRPLRDQINQMLLDGLPYAEIIPKLGDPGKDLNVDNIGEWKKRGYRDWLLQQEWLDRMTSKSSFSADILSAPETSSLHEAGLRFAAAQMFDQLMRFNAVLDSPDSTDSPDTSDKFARLVNALSRLNRAALSFKKYADLRADLKERQPRLLDPKQQILDEQCSALATLFDRHFRMPHPDFARPPGPPSAPNNLQQEGRASEDHNQPATLPLLNQESRAADHNQPAALPLPRGEGRGEGKPDARTP